MSIIRQIARLTYHAIRSKADRRHRLKWSQEFTMTMAVAGHTDLSEDELADCILEWADATHHEPEELAEATYTLACYGCDEEVLDTLRHVIDLAELGDCDLTTAADTITSAMTLFDTDPGEVVDSLYSPRHFTNLTISDIGGILESVGPFARMADLSLWHVMADIDATHHRLYDPANPDKDLSREIRNELRDKYDRELETSND